MTYPILEFDPTREAFTEPSKLIKPQDVPEHCVICFFSEVLEKVVSENRASVAVKNRWEDGHPEAEAEIAEQQPAQYAGLHRDIS